MKFKNPSQYIWEKIEHLEGTAATTLEIEDAVRALFKEIGAESAPYQYPMPDGTLFPAYICTSVNDVVCHGVPDDKPINWEKDIVNVDISFEWKGKYYDTCKSWGKQELSKISKYITEALAKRAMPSNTGSICTAAIGNHTQTLAKHWLVEAVPEFTGHGIGERLHMPPAIPSVGEIREIIFPFDIVDSFTIEPIITDGVNFAQTEVQLFKGGGDDY